MEHGRSTQHTNIIDNGRTVCMDAYVSTFSGDYMTLNVDDYDSRTSYTLRFVRAGGYDW